MVPVETMPRIADPPVYSWLLFILIMLWTGSLNAQFGENIVLYPTELDAIVKFDGTNRRNGTDSRETEWEAGFRVGQIGYVLDPEIAWFLIDIEPVYTWSEFDSSVTR